MENPNYQTNFNYARNIGNTHTHTHTCLCVHIHMSKRMQCDTFNVTIYLPHGV